MAEVPVEVGAVGLFESGAEAEVGELDVAARVQQKVVGLDVSENGLKCNSGIRGFEKMKGYVASGLCLHCSYRGQEE